MTIARSAAIAAMYATDWLSRDFLEDAGIKTEVPTVPGALPAVAREPFTARELKELFDLIVIFSIGDFPDGKNCSSYFDPRSPWYNVFYGAYGLKSYKPGGVAWGYDAKNQLVPEELLRVPAIDYDFLTAGELGCPPSKMCFEVKRHTVGRDGNWDTIDCEVVVPSGLHQLSHAVKPNLLYYAAFGYPDDELAKTRADYEPVAMKGRMYSRVVAPQVTLVWGALCPATIQGVDLFDRIISTMKPHYP